jgi:hypothetical protein
MQLNHTSLLLKKYEKYEPFELDEPKRRHERSLGGKGMTTLTRGKGGWTVLDLHRGMVEPDTKAY